MESAKLHYLTYLSRSASVLVCVHMGVHDALFKLMTYVPHSSLHFTAVSFVIERLWRVSLNKENNQCGPTTTPLLFSLFLWNRMLWIQHQTGVKGRRQLHKLTEKPFSSTELLVHTTIRAYRNQILTTTYHLELASSNHQTVLLRSKPPVIDMLIIRPQTTSHFANIVPHLPLLFCFREFMDASWTSHFYFL